MTILPLLSRRLTSQNDSPRSGGPQGGGGWFGAVAVIALSMALAVALLGIDWHRVLVRGNSALPENQRSMVVAPMPR
ncbi:hypothetical protein GBZ26_14055 [Azospirillum formosense]|uniref:Uncharacterized protein n=1 Tax=Azospirillum formosense TaxID=861533 RepID=A0ABX2KX67_9PROT|nr:hypothetical protein [Azospirillum formosense]MBY3753067.1 hypothetical protein [Azospirillum formosense]NUB20329.1 hypothetical protein [Azospirillum formosense]